MIYNLGATVTLQWVNGVDLGAATLTVTGPTGVVTTTAGVVAASGTYTAPFTPSAPGLHLVGWTAGSVTKGAYQDVFEVRATGPAALISLDDARSVVRLRSTNTADNAMLQTIIEAASKVVTDITGPMTIAQYVEWFDGGTETVVPSQAPIVRIVSAFEYYRTSSFALTEQPLGAQTTAFGFTVDYLTGAITRRTFGGGSGLFAVGSKNIVFTYTAGRATVPENVQLATKELVRHFYQATQIPGRPKMGAVADDGFGEVSIGFAVPNFVVEMLQPDRRAPGIA
jgi:hypothetical protein